MFGRRQRREQRRAAAAIAHAEATRAELEVILAPARDLPRFQEISRAAVSPIPLDPDEYLVIGVDDAFRLVGTSQPPGKLRGWTGGVGVPVGPVGVGIGRINATYDVGPMDLRVTDPANFQNTAFPESGSFYVTSQRALYLGRARSGEWPFSKVIAVQQIDNTPDQSTDDADTFLAIPAATVFHVRGERDVAGVAYPSTNAHLVRIRIAFAMAIHADNLKAFASAVEDQMAALPLAGDVCHQTS